VTGVMVAYLAPRLEPTESGSRISWYWTVRGAFHQRDGWMTAKARVAPWWALPVAWRLVRLGLTAQDAAELEALMRGQPGIQVSRFTTETTEEER
jgi:hypothetical protein